MLAYSFVCFDVFASPVMASRPKYRKPLLIEVYMIWKLTCFCSVCALSRLPNALYFLRNEAVSYPIATLGFNIDKPKTKDTCTFRSP